MVAKNQFNSTLSFTVRSEEFESPLDILGGLGKSTTSTSMAGDILFEFVQSQKMVSVVDKKIDLISLFSKAQGDPYYNFEKTGYIEDLRDYWLSMISIAFDAGTGLTEINTRAFTPEDAQKISKTILSESTDLINRLNIVARNDATEHAKSNLAKAVEQLKSARTNLSHFRARTQIIDPRANLQGQMGIVNQLETQLASSMIELDLILSSNKYNEQRLNQAELRVQTIQNRIKAERTRLAGDDGEGQGTLSILVGDFERLEVERSFAEEKYLGALTAYDIALEKAQRQSLYLAAHIEPTLAQKSLYPERLKNSFIMFTLLFLFWALLILIFYSLRDRR